MKKEKTQPIKKTEKKVYKKPKVVSEEVFETLALACCKGNVCRLYGFPRGLHGIS